MSTIDSIFETNESTSQLLQPLEGIYNTDRIVLADSGKDCSVLLFNRPVDDASPSDAADRTLIQRMPDRKMLQYGTWEVGLEYASKILSAVWPKEQLIFQNNDVRMQYLQSIARDKIFDHAARRAANWKETKRLYAHGWDIHTERPLNDYQQLVLCNSMQTDYLFFGDMGTGKTPTSIAVICNEQKRKPKIGGTYITLVVCPNQVKLNWSEEIERFATQPLHVQIVDGQALQRNRQVIDGIAIANQEGKGLVLIIGWDSLSCTMECLRFIQYDMLIADELHYAKSQNTLRWKALKELRDQSKKKIGLTGDPVSNTIFDLYTQLEFLYAGASGFTSFENFKTFYGVYDKDWNNDGHSKLVALQNVPFIREQLARKAFLISKAEALPNLPKNVTSVQGVEMSGEQSKVYNTVMLHMMAEIEETIERDQRRGIHATITANNVLTTMLRLAQIAAGFYKTDDTLAMSGEVMTKGGIVYFRQNNKIDQLIDILKARDSLTKTIVWACFVPAIEQISDHLSMHGFGHATYYGKVGKKQREVEVKQFNSNPACTVFLANQACAGEGLNLLGYDPHSLVHADTNASQSIFFCQNFSKTQRTQPEARNHRIGTRVQVETIDLVTLGTIDVEIRKRVIEKRKMALEISDVREMMSRLGAQL